jgi:2-iminobutanoate/2-iminopropanoate deaminase
MAARERIRTEHAPQAIGPYSQGIKTGKFVYTAGQTPIDPATGKLVEGDIAEQTAQVISNLSAILQAAGCTLDDVVKTTVFLMDMGNFAAMNEVYKRFFSSDSPPARSTIQVAGLPMGARVEIECVAVLPEGPGRQAGNHEGNGD